MTLIVLGFVATLLGTVVRKHQERQLLPHLTIQFVNVGDGDCALIVTPNKRTILVDTGNAAAAPQLARALRSQSVQDIDLLILTSPRDASIGGVEALTSSGARITSAWMYRDRLSRSGQPAFRTLRRHGIPVRYAHARDEISFDGLRLVVLWPPERDIRSRLDALVCRVEYGDDSFLLAGGATSLSEPYWISGLGERLHSELVQVPDHGGEGAVLPELIRQAGPSTAVISCSAEKRPTESTLQTLVAAGVANFRTDTLGDVTVKADGKSPLVVISERQ
jgi:competence protein ComEC